MKTLFEFKQSPPILNSPIADQNQVGQFRNMESVLNGWISICIASDLVDKPKYLRRTRDLLTTAI